LRLAAEEERAVLRLEGAQAAVGIAGRELGALRGALQLLERGAQLLARRVARVGVAAQRAIDDGGEARVDRGRALGEGLGVARAAKEGSATETGGGVAASEGEGAPGFVGRSVAALRSDGVGGDGGDGGGDAVDGAGGVVDGSAAGSADGPIVAALRSSSLPGA